jgi:hypothetical protein
MVSVFTLTNASGVHHKGKNFCVQASYFILFTQYYYCNEHKEDRIDKHAACMEEITELEIKLGWNKLEWKTPTVKSTLPFLYTLLKNARHRISFIN